MKFWLLPCVFALATACSHSAAKVDAKAPSTAPATAASAAPTASPKARRDITTKITASASSAPTHALCKSATEQRELLIVPKGTGCELEYTKEKQQKMIATAEHESDLCKQVLQKVRGHLEAAGFSCN